MSFKNEMKREIRNIKKDVASQVEKTWKLDYQGHSIEIINQLMEERLLIDGVEVDANVRKSIFSHIFPFSKLSGILTMADGSVRKVKVKLGGFVRFTCTVKVGSETISQETVALNFLPWEHKEEIEPYIEAQITMHGEIVTDDLPDDELLYDENHPRYVAGLADLYLYDSPTPFYVKSLLKLFEGQLQNPTTKTRKATYEKINDEHVAIYGGEFAERLLQAQLDEKTVQQEALWLLEHAAHREVIKFALLVLGCTNCDMYKERIYRLGLHDEFTTYAIFALKNGTSQANDSVWQLAKSVHGWGKLAAIEELDAHTAEQKLWLLTAEWQNPMMLNYAALTCASKGELDITLYEDEISPAIFRGAGKMIAALLNEHGPNRIDDYSYASAILLRFVYHAKTHCETLGDFYPLMKIHEFVHEDEEVWEQRMENQWKPYERNTLRESVQLFIDDPKWSTLAQDALQQEDFELPLEITRFYKIDVMNWLFEKLHEIPRNLALYIEVMETKNERSIMKLTQFAEQHLDLASPTDEEADCLQVIIQELYQYDGLGIPLIVAALQSDRKPLQYHALAALAEWSSSNIQQPAIQQTINNLATLSKDKEIRQIAKSIIEVGK